jgi:membrane-bound metal-dependent hydrolase YbcI (DUF457 family)
MKRHRADLVSLIFGMAFLMIAGWWALARRVDVNLPAAGWLAAVALIILGAVGLVCAVRGPKDEENEAEPPHGTPR